MNTKRSGQGVDSLEINRERRKEKIFKIVQIKKILGESNDIYFCGRRLIMSKSTRRRGEASYK